MGRLFDRSQIDWLQDARIGLANVSVTGGSTNVTSALTTALSTAGDGGVAVPLQVADSTAIGVIVTPPNNLCRIVQTSNRSPISDGNGNEVYGRLTQSGGVYTLTYFSLANGTETAYSFGSATNINFYPAYRFDAARFPKDAGIAIAAQLIQDDPTVSVGSSSQVAAPVPVTVTGTNTLAALPSAPSATNRIILYINGKAEFPTGGSPAFSHAGTALTWSAANAGYSLNPSTHEVYALVW